MRRAPRSLCRVAATGLTALALAAAACGGPFGGGVAPARPAPASAPTRVVAFTPDHFTAAARLTGHCWTGSVAAPRRGAYRCMVGNGILDPCFTGVGAGEVACPDPRANPDLQKGTVIRLTQPLPAGSAAAPSPLHPWRFVLAGGASCGAMTGTVLPDHPYGCAAATPAPGGAAGRTAGAGSLYCTAPRQAGPGPSYTASCAPLAPTPAPDGAPRLDAGRTYRIDAMWL